MKMEAEYLLKVGGAQFVILSFTHIEGIGKSILEACHNPSKKFVVTWPIYHEHLWFGWETNC
ncbi:hypothetical protein M3650_30435 [Paenibacillus sp. MER TA 81-3]|uniref:hypothetical protein n=1 Tax=Paenibacillus sp. MER TA 81-3 TaxID=2939573 RepID=UPI00203B91D8|nr:hypothetical protein [Paenibacillus sp. MER TA 81-3]MCM3342830.1 hypothetical protein [Paenibacillus sp. MER TA 81-3]